MPVRRTGVRREFVYFPSGSANEAAGVYTSWPNLVAAVVVETTPALIEFRGDGVTSGMTIPTGIWDFTPVLDLAWTGAVGTPLLGGVIPTLTFAPGAQVRVAGALSVSFMNLVSGGPLGWLEPQGAEHVIHMVSAAFLVSSGLGPVLLATTAQYVLVDSVSAIQSSGAPGGTIQVDAGDFLFILTTNGTLEDDTIVGLGIGFGALGDWHNGGGGTFGQTQSGLALWSTALLSRAELVNYAPVVPSNWGVPTPTTVQQALDALSAGTGSRDCSSFSTMALVLLTGADVHLGFSGGVGVGAPGFAGSINLLPVLTFAADKIATRPGFFAGGAIRSTLAITIDVFVEVQVGGVGPYIKTIVVVGLVLAPTTIAVLAFAPVPFTAGDVLRAGFTLVSIGPVTPDVNFELEIAY